MEAMACGLPCVVSKIRGNEDLIENEKGGYCVDLENEKFNIYINKILELYFLNPCLLLIIIKFQIIL